MACAEEQSVLSPPVRETNLCKSEANRSGGLCDRGPRQRLEPIYLRAGGETGVFYMEANLCKSETNLRLTAHVGGQQVRAKSATAPRWIAGRWCRAAQIIIKSKYSGQQVYS